MRRSGNTHAAADGGRQRYAAVVEKGENAWRREWSTFMSGVDLKRLRDGSSGVSLKAGADIERQISDATHENTSSSVRHREAVMEVNSDGIPLDARAGAVGGYAYLFSSPAERRAEREAKDREERARRTEEKRARLADTDPLRVMSKHQRALYDAAQRGLILEGLNRKAQRDFLRLTVTEAQQKAEAQSREFKLHDLMDPKMAWYQQGPHPVDLIAEKLVRRKAEKKAKQLGLRYNYLAPHPSWLAKRAERRRESVLVGLGRRLIFNVNNFDEGSSMVGEEDKDAITVTDPVRHRTVPLRDMKLLLSADKAKDVECSAPTAEPPAEPTKNEEEDEEGVESEEKGEEAVHMGAVAEKPLKKKKKEVQEAATSKPDRHTTTTAAAGVARMPDVGVLQDPTRIATAVVRSVVRDRATALAIQQMNRTTTFMSAGLVSGPNLAAEDVDGVKRGTLGGPGLSVSAFMAAQKEKVKIAVATAANAKRPSRASAVPSFSPYADPEPRIDTTTAAPEEEAEKQEDEHLREKQRAVRVKREGGEKTERKRVREVKEAEAAGEEEEVKRKTKAVTRRVSRKVESSGEKTKLNRKRSSDS